MATKDSRSFLGFWRIGCFSQPLQFLLSSIVAFFLPWNVNIPFALADALRDTRIPALYSDADRFDQAWKAATNTRGEFQEVTGIIVPHHLLAIDVIAKVFKSIRSNGYERVFVLFPDHYFVSETPVATTLRSFDTAFGLVETDQAMTTALADDTIVARVPKLFETDHGIHAILPFIAKLFPQALVVPIALRIDSKQREVQALFEHLKLLVGPDTLVVLSCDFSHYLPFEQALMRDQETLNLLAAREYSSLDALTQPDHVDSLAGLRLQTALQKHLGAELFVIESKNSQQYSDDRVAETTSYIGAVFTRRLAGAKDASRRPADLCFGGDVFTGRNLRSLVRDSEMRHLIVELIQDAIGACPLVVNLEAVLTSRPVVGAPPLALWADAESTVDLMVRLGVVAVSLANNHSKDFGEHAYQETASTLRNAEFQVIEHGEISDLGKLRVFGLTEVSKKRGEQYAAIAQRDLDVLRRGALEPPVIAFVHWGRQFETAPKEPQIKLAGDLRSLGVSAIIGAHPHRSSGSLFTLNGGATLVAYSLGNLLFDQLDERASGSILELYLFDQGTFFVRQVKIPNLYKSIQQDYMAPSIYAPPGLPSPRHRRIPTIGKMARTSGRYQ